MNISKLFSSHGCQTQGQLTDIKVKRAGGMKDSFQPRRLNHLVKRIGLRNIGDNNDLQPIGLILVRIADLLSLVLGADCRDDGVALLEELVKDMGCGRTSWSE